MGALTNQMGAIGGAINKVGKGTIGGVQKVGGQIGLPGLGKKKPPNQLTAQGALGQQAGQLGAIGTAMGGPGQAQPIGGGINGAPPQPGGQPTPYQFPQPMAGGPGQVGGMPQVFNDGPAPGSPAWQRQATTVAHPKSPGAPQPYDPNKAIFG